MDRVNEDDGERGQHAEFYHAVDVGSGFRVVVSSRFLCDAVDGFTGVF